MAKTLSSPCPYFFFRNWISKSRVCTDGKIFGIGNRNYDTGSSVGYWCGNNEVVNCYEFVMWLFFLKSQNNEYQNNKS